MRGTSTDLLLGPDGSPVARLNDTATALWELCDGVATVAEIVAAVTELTGRADVATEVTDTLEDLIALGALTLLSVRDATHDHQQ